MIWFIGRLGLFYKPRSCSRWPPKNNSWSPTDHNLTLVCFVPFHHLTTGWLHSMTWAVFVLANPIRTKSGPGMDFCQKECDPRAQSRLPIFSPVDHFYKAGFISMQNSLSIKRASGSHLKQVCYRDFLFLFIRF